MEKLVDGSEEIMEILDEMQRIDDEIFELGDAEEYIQRKVNSLSACLVFMRQRREKLKKKKAKFVERVEEIKRV